MARRIVLFIQFKERVKFNTQQALQTFFQIDPQLQIIFVRPVLPAKEGAVSAILTLQQQSSGVVASCNLPTDKVHFGFSDKLELHAWERQVQFDIGQQKTKRH